MQRYEKNSNYEHKSLHQLSIRAVRTATSSFFQPPRRWAQGALSVHSWSTLYSPFFVQFPNCSLRFDEELLKNDTMRMGEGANLQLVSSDHAVVVATVWKVFALLLKRRPNSIGNWHWRWSCCGCANNPLPWRHGGGRCCSATGLGGPRDIWRPLRLRRMGRTNRYGKCAWHRWTKRHGSHWSGCSATGARRGAVRWDWGASGQKRTAAWKCIFRQLIINSQENHKKWQPAFLT